MSQQKFRFGKGKEYAFFNEHVHLLLIDFERDNKKELFLIAEQEADGTYILDYPGELFTEQLHELTGSIFFVQVQEEEREGKYVLGAYFTCERKTYALYYDREHPESGEMVFFRANSTGTGTYDLENITDQEEYQTVVEFIMERYGQFLQA
ncbi:DUF1292 domain-containing protein [Tumebacillus permanentifrigoris]|uniref:Uncharacterized protein DUF1292 n=1 Tax=Tumebacillus permanentifrigoris TaxID=378543 RepID=A0A316D4S4_9BACL|nr:DUF1292 domain-containing protein [Tumebacillus permanentifrigoris]PWK06974.1 uncharacterized protein DUF1292 [Tumebacillus permanentifrigoris]